MNGELLRLIDAIHRDKDIDKEILFDALEQALLSAARRKYPAEEHIRVRIDRDTGEVRAYGGDEKILPIDLGRIAAQTAKQVIIQKIREAESDVLFGEYARYRGQLMNGQVQRVEPGGTIVVNLGKIEAYLPRHEQVRGENYRVGDRIRAFVVEVRKAPQKVKIILSRSHPEMIARLFELEVPEVAEGLIELKKLVREAGYKTKVAVESSDAKVDAIGACVGVRGTRIRNIIEEIGGEKIDIIRWNDSIEVLLMNSLKPAQVDSITLFPDRNRALVIVAEDQLSLAIGRKGQNVRLASKLVGWDIDIMTEDEARQQGVSFAEVEGQPVEYIDEETPASAAGPSPLRSPRRREGGAEAPGGAKADGDAAPAPAEETPPIPADAAAPIPAGEVVPAPEQADPAGVDGEAAPAPDVPADAPPAGEDGENLFGPPGATGDTEGQST
jgi:N utilization substance protein A